MTQTKAPMPALLNQKKFLIMDCQTTGMQVSGNHLLEIAWAVWDSKTLEPEIHNHILRLPQDVAVPSNILKMTGITDEQLLTGLDPLHSCFALEKVLTSMNDDKPIVICHYAQFEQKFLKELYKQYRHTDTLPFEMLCSQKITKRLLPSIPSLTLLGVAGYFGLTAPTINRARSHVEATFAIWHKLVDKLNELAIHTLDELTDWLQTKTTVGKKYEYRIEKLARLNFPSQPGIYRMLNCEGKILYVGKATSLKNRVNSYFRGSKNKNKRIQEMLAQVWDIQVVACDSPLEAALFESDEIKTHMAPYNIVLKKSDRVFHFYNKNYMETSPDQNEVYQFGPFRPHDALDNLKLLHEGFQIEHKMILLFENLTTIELELGFKQFCLETNIDQDFLQKLTMRQLLCLAFKLLRKHTKQYPRRDFEKEWKQLKSRLKAQPDYNNLLASPNLVAAKIQRIFLRAANAMIRAKSLTKLLNSKVFIKSFSGYRALTFHHGQLNGKKIEIDYPWQTATIAELDRMSILLTGINKSRYRVELITNS